MNIFNFFNPITTEQDFRDRNVQFPEIYKLEKTNIDELREVSPELTEAAKNGDPKAFEQLGDMFSKSYSVEKNLEKAAELYEKAMQLVQRQAEREATSLVNREIEGSYHIETEEKLKLINFFTRRIERCISPRPEEYKMCHFGETAIENKLINTYFELLKTKPSSTYEHILSEAENGNKVAQYLIGYLDYYTNDSIVPMMYGNGIDPDISYETLKDVSALSDFYIHNNYFSIENLEKSAQQGYVASFCMLVGLYIANTDTHPNGLYSYHPTGKKEQLSSLSVEKVKELIFDNIYMYDWLFGYDLRNEGLMVGHFKDISDEFNMAWENNQINNEFKMAWENYNHNQ